eukprot:TRINITY_DN15020_c1_g1_i1.p1 TRINITY_DN15020_c1_g1~~TRINITY_DN15020_c1_g1_i1.p1  ORF type:complete len:412 (+),score=120.04 TRINITY_DN15020_c1_g1_i1:104-1339(+)
MEFIGGLAPSGVEKSLQDEVATMLILVSEARQQDLRRISAQATDGAARRRDMRAAASKWRQVREEVCTSLVAEQENCKVVRAIFACKYPFLGVLSQEAIQDARVNRESTVERENRKLYDAISRSPSPTATGTSVSATVTTTTTTTTTTGVFHQETFSNRFEDFVLCGDKHIINRRNLRGGARAAQGVLEAEAGAAAAAQHQQQQHDSIASLFGFIDDSVSLPQDEEDESAAQGMPLHYPAYDDTEEADMAFLRQVSSETASTEPLDSEEDLNRLLMQFSGLALSTASSDSFVSLTGTEGRDGSADRDSASPVDLDVDADDDDLRAGSWCPIFGGGVGDPAGSSAVAVSGHEGSAEAGGGLTWKKHHPLAYTDILGTSFSSLHSQSSSIEGDASSCGSSLCGSPELVRFLPV